MSTYQIPGIKMIQHITMREKTIIDRCVFDPEYRVSYVFFGLEVYLPYFTFTGNIYTMW